MENKTIQLPIDSLSYSSLTQLLRNPLIFKLKYILGVYDNKAGVSMMIGKAGHEALKAYYGSNPDYPVEGDAAGAKEVGLKYLNEFDDSYIDYGATGSRESMLKYYNSAIDFYFAEEPKYHEIVMAEEKMTAELKTVDGDQLPLPASGIPDLVHKRKDGGVEIIDFKFVRAFTSYDEEDYIKIIQSQFMYHLLWAAKGIRADRMLFREIKYTQNSNGNAGQPQVRDYAIPFSHEQYRVIFYNLYRDVVKFLSNDPIFLPNLADGIEGKHAGLMYSQGLINADMSDVEVMHKVRDVAFTSKKFVSSRLDRAENKDLLPEEKIKIRLAEFGLPVEPVETIEGSSVIQYRFKISAGVRMSSIKKHREDIMRTLAAKGDIRLLTPIPGTEYFGVEIEKAERQDAKFRKEYLKPGTLNLPLGISVNGELTNISLIDMPHLLIAGATGSGKSVALNVIITALSKQMPPEAMKMLLIDPKRVELASWRRLPHLEGKGIIYEYKDAVGALMELSDEMDKRYKLLEKGGKKNLEEYNESRRDDKNKLPYIVAVVDEFADFILRSKKEEKKRKKKPYSGMSLVALRRELKKRAPNEDPAGSKYDLIVQLEELDKDDEMNRIDADVEYLVVRLAQLGRAAGIHLIIATQRPSVDVITGLIKANFPTRIAFTTSSPTDSKVILGDNGAEKLSGRGDMLLMHPSLKGLRRLQGLIKK